MSRWQNARCALAREARLDAAPDAGERRVEPRRVGRDPGDAGRQPVDDLRIALRWRARHVELVQVALHGPDLAQPAVRGGRVDALGPVGGRTRSGTPRPRRVYACVS
jgi:hypothetical protein